MEYVPLQDYVKQPGYDGVAPSPKAAFILDKATRDRLVLIDMHLAPLMRRYVTLDDIERLLIRDAQRFLLALPVGWTAQTCHTTTVGQDAWQSIAEHSPALARHLALHVAERFQNEQCWWELDDHLPRPHARIITWKSAASKVLFAHTPPGYVSAAAWFESDESWLVSLLNSTPMQRWLGRQSARHTLDIIAQLPVPTALATHSELGEYSARQHETAQRIMRIEQAGVQALVQNFAPLGAKITPAVRNWMNHDFERLRKALRTAFQNDIPERHWPEWQVWLETAQQEYQQSTEQLHQIDTRINAIVGAHLPAPQG